MKKIIFIIGLCFIGISANSQVLNPFPTTDSLRKFINKWIRNSAVDAFTNLRLNTSLIGMSRFLDSAYGGQVTGFTYSNDTIRLALLSGDTLKISLPSATGNSNLGAGFRILTPSSQGIKTLFAGAGVAIDSTSNTDGLTFKVDSTSALRGNFIGGIIDPSSSIGVNSDFYWNQQKSVLWRKASGAWSQLGYLYSDTVIPRSTDRWQGTFVKMKTVWDTAAMSYFVGGIARNQNHPGNTNLTYKDDPVFVRGWNVNENGSTVDNWKAKMIWHDESNYQTDPFQAVPWFESHISFSQRPGSQGYNYAQDGGYRILSLNINQERYEGYAFWTLKYMRWLWQRDSASLPVEYTRISPEFFRASRKFVLDSTAVGANWFEADGIGIGIKELVNGRDRFMFNRSGFRDTAILRADVGDFVFIRSLGSGRTMFNLPVGIGLSSDDGNGRAPVQLNQTGELFTHYYSSSALNFDVSLHNSVYGLSLNKGTSRQAYLDISNRDAGFNFNAYFTNNTTNLDSVGNGVDFNFEKTYLNSFTSSSLQNTDGYKFNLNDVCEFGAYLNASTGSNGRYLSDFRWKTIGSGGSTMTDRMLLNSEGNLRLNGNYGIDTDPLYDIHVENGTAIIANVNTTALGSTSGGLLNLYAKDLPTAANQRLGAINFGTRNGASAENFGVTLDAFTNAAWTDGSAKQAYARLLTNSSGVQNEVMRWTANARVGIGAVTNPGARVQIAAGFASSGGAPLMFTAGTNLTTPAAGAEEYDGTSRFFTPGSTRLRYVLTNNAIPSNGQIPIGNSTDFTLATITEGTGIDITNGSGSITVAVDPAYINQVVKDSAGYYTVTGTTTDATPTTIVTIPFVDGSLTAIEATGIGITGDGDNGYSAVKYRSYLKNSSSALVSGSLTTLVADNYMNALSTATFTLTNSGVNAIIQVTGEAATTIHWKIRYKLVSINVSF